MLIALHVFNTSDPIGERGFRQSSSYSPEGLPTAAIAVQNLTPASKVVDLMLHCVGGARVQVLRTLAHGNSGYYDFPYMWIVDMISLEYRRLKGSFAENARYELHGCGVASETDILKKGVDVRDARPGNTVPGTFRGQADGRGLKYLRRVAVVFGVNVVAGIDVQTAPPNSWGFEGDTVTVSPNGKFATDSEGTRDWDIEATNRAAMNWLNTIDELYVQSGRVTEGRMVLQQLIAKYPRTWAAKYAKERLGRTDLKKAPSEQLPDGSWTL
jgi:hypothetical protein